jgi:gluconokinase
VAQRVSVTIGTSAAVRTITTCPAMSSPLGADPNIALPAAGLFCYRLDRTHVVLGGAMSDGGSLLNWLREFVGDDLVLVHENLKIMTRINSPTVQRC